MMKKLILIPILFLAKWGFSQIVQPLFGGVNNNVSDLTIYDGKLIIGGGFNTVDSMNIWGICSWDGQYFDSLGPGLKDPDSNYPRLLKRLYVYNNKLYIGGAFDSIGSIRVNGLAAWNGINWSALNTGVFSVDPFNQTFNNGVVADIFEYDNQLHIFGCFEYVYTSAVNSTAKWDGNYLTLGIPDLDCYAGLGVQYKGKAIVTSNSFDRFLGISNLGQYNGDNSWTSLDSAFGTWGGIYKMLEYKGDLYIAGYFLKAMGNNGNFIVRWNGEEWDDLMGGANDIIGDIAILNDELIVAGYFSQIGNIQANRLAKWDGSKWCGYNLDIKNYDGTGGAIYAVEGYNDKIYIGGNFASVNGINANRICALDIPDSAWVCGSPLAVKEEKSVNFSIFPNPASDFITIKNKINQNGNYTYSIFDYQGKKIKDGSLSFSNSTEKISIQEFNSGIYFIRIENEKGVSVEKFVKL